LLEAEAIFFQLFPIWSRLFVSANQVNQMFSDVAKIQRINIPNPEILQDGILTFMTV
jgi:hypothetical protein